MGLFSLPPMAGASLSEADRLILEASAARQLTGDELRRVLEHVAQAGFDPNARERAGGRIAGLIWQGRALRPTDTLPPAVVHYLRHVVIGQEWPPATMIEDYLHSIEEIVLDRRSGLLTSRYQGQWQLTVIRRSLDLHGPAGFDWVLVDYRVGTGRWMTAYQPREGLGVLQHPLREDVRWLRRPA